MNGSKLDRWEWYGIISVKLATNYIGVNIIRTDFSLMDKDLRITFFVNDHKIKTYINEHSDEIKKRLVDHFNNLILEVAISEKKIEEFDTEQMISESTKLLDVRA